MVSSCEIKQQNIVSNFISKVDTTSPYVNSVYYDKIEPLLVTYQNTVSAIAVKEEEYAKLVSATAETNAFFNREIIINTDFITQYPYLYDRIQTMTLITPPEVQTVIDDTFLTLDTYSDYLTPYKSIIPSLFNDYYSPGSFSNSGMKSFCSLVPNIFAAYNNLMNAFEDIKGYANTFNNILSAIQEFSVAGLLESLKKQALAVIDQIVEQVRAKINEVTGLFTRIANFRIHLDNVYSKMHEEKQKIDQVISEPSINNLKAAVEGAISFASSLFEELKIEEIQFLILRFCELISGIENFFKDLTKPLEDIPDNFRRSFEYIKAANFGAAARSTAAGAFRIPSSQRIAGGAMVDDVPATIVGGNGVTFGDEGVTVTGGIGVRQRAYKISPISDEELAILNNELTFENVAEGGSSHIELLKGESFSIDGPAIWTRVRPLEKAMLYRLSVRLGRKLTVNSAYRSLYAQSAINPSVRSSWHSSGQAFDIRMSSFSGTSFEEFKGHANSIGFSRVRPYWGDGFVHIDTGPPSQTW